MDVVWLILDSLSFSATPFAEDGPDTMPQLASLAEDQGVVFTNAYPPGVISPSSHAGFLTGQHPSSVGTFAANPHFSGVRTIADALNETHRSFLISANPFLFRGFEQSFSQSEYLSNRDYLIFPSASDPREVDFRDRPELQSASTPRRIAAFCLKDGKPLRSFVNGVSYSFHQALGTSTFIPSSAPKDECKYQYADTMNEAIRAFIRTDGDAFVVANFMDVHPPLDASDDALNRFAPDFTKSQLPIGVKGQEIHDRIQNDDEYKGEDMYVLYKAGIWDLDRKIGPMVRGLLDEGAMVVVTADHGNWFRRESELDEERLHVPLIIFSPDEPARTIDHTVNLLHLPSTTTEEVFGQSGGFEGESLLSVEQDQISFTEYIHTPDSSDIVNTSHNRRDQIIRDVVAISGETRIDYVDGELMTARGNDEQTLKQIKRELQKHIRQPIRFSETETESYDDVAISRLKELGYVED